MPDLSSLLDGQPAPGAPGGRVERRNPADLRDVVADGRARRRRDLRRRLRGRRARPSAAWAATSRAGPRPRDRSRSAGWSRTTRRRSPALVTREIGKPLRRVARRGAGDRRHLRLLPRRGPAALRPDRAERDAGQAALHVPRAGRRRGDHHRGQLPGRRAVAGTSCRRCCAATPSSGSRPSTPPRCGDALAQLFLHGGLPDGRAATSCSPTAPTDVRRARARARRRAWSTRSASPARPTVGRADRRALRPPPAVAVPRARRQEPAGRDAPTPTSTSPSRARCSAASAPPGQRCTSLGTADRRTSDVHDEFLRRFDARGARRRRSATRPQDVLYGPMIDERFLERFETSGSGWSATTTRVLGSTGIGRITRRQPARRASSATPTPASSATRRSSTASAPDDELVRHRDVRPDRRRRRVRRLRRGDRARQRPRLRAVVRRSTRRDPTHAFRFRERVSAGMVSVNNSTSRRRGAPARSAATASRATARASPGVWVLDQFTRWQSMNWDYAGTPAEGADGRRRRRRRPRLPARRLSAT